ncbi:hypothetical protein D9757_005093 [Collybiopsis confluens]|uniref:FAD-binding domain-containing protein n=1 Tax=Collybiopsis confluens TaxID=2823264 RepID=A0A8H5HTD8_9AGAR|nr:hypothetical protein D9757_005093 [Collybiopsis confluens]
MVFLTIGADELPTGAHSWMRQQLGVTLEGEKTEYVWGVIDVCMHTDFPDARLKCIIQSSQGAMIIIPREEDKLRFYVQCSPKDRISELNEDIKNKLLQRISDGLRPYKITFTQIFWYTIFSVPQKVASKFRVGPIFLAGDACHTHSPKAGQGANISMGDAHNLGKSAPEIRILSLSCTELAWKLAWVLRGWSDDSLLDTYEIERRTLAIQLIEFDKAISASLNGCEASRYSSMLHEQNLFTSGVGIRYRSQLMVEANNREVSLSDTFSLEIGTRLPPMNIVRFADWHPMDIQDLAASDGLFKIIIFSGDLQGDIESKGLREFAEHLQLLADKKQGSILFKQFTMFTVVTEYKESDIWSFIPPFLRNWRRYSEYNKPISMTYLP